MTRPYPQTRFSSSDHCADHGHHGPALAASTRNAEPEDQWNGCAAHPLAATGIEILKAGGNVVDAAQQLHSRVGVVEPMAPTERQGVMLILGRFQEDPGNRLPRSSSSATSLALEGKAPRRVSCYGVPGLSPASKALDIRNDDIGTGAGVVD